MYIPPFQISSKAIHLIAEISALIERYAIRLEQSDGLRLRKVNRIKTIHSSLAIEGNLLPEGEVEAIVEGKHIVAPVKQIQEVRNAIRTYEAFPGFNPFEEKHLLEAHRLMMEALIDEAGLYRRKGVGVFSEKGLIHMAPPADRVPYLMRDLFQWLASSADHLLIRSCVFHYEFEFIHPFSDGNGRMGRLWQSLILSRLHPLFAHLPVENMVYSNQESYYEAIAQSSREGQCGAFIDFMLNEIYQTLCAHQVPELSGYSDKLHDKLHDKLSDATSVDLAILAALSANPNVRAEMLAADLGYSVRTIRMYLSKLRAAGIIEREGSNKTGRWIVL